MPPVPSIIIALIFFQIFRLILKNMVFAFFAGFLLGYLVYASIHYSMHAMKPPKNKLRFLWEYHSKHHYKYPDKAFGVSSPFWDYIFGSLPPSEIKRPTTIKTGESINVQK
jgi:sterol desaturase/sphingolipid hydroxylase (fatty acid hydroxylase superfamily)